MTDKTKLSNCKHSLSIVESKRGETPKRYWCCSCGLKYTKEIIIKEILNTTDHSNNLGDIQQ